MASPCNKMLIIFVSCLFFHSSFSPNLLLANAAANLIDDICAHVPKDPAFCKTAFNSDPRSAKADLATLGTIGITLAHNHTKSSVTLLTTMDKNATDAKLKPVIDMCLKGFNQTTSGLKDAATALTKKDYATMNIRASAALDGPASCDSEFKPPTAEPATLKTSNNQVQALCSAICYIANKLAGKAMI